jgi:hypothetical protein
VDHQGSLWEQLLLARNMLVVFWVPLSFARAQQIINTNFHNLFRYACGESRRNALYLVWPCFNELFLYKSLFDGLRQFAAKHRIGVRGNIFSYPMPWTDIMESLLVASSAAKRKECIVPHPPEVVAHMVRLHLKLAGGLEVTRHMKEVCVRTHVVLQLGYDLIESGHPALVHKTNAGPVPRAEVARIKEAYRQEVEKYYPTSTDAAEAERGRAPETILRVSEESQRAKQRNSPLHNKNATPEAGVMTAGTVFDAVQPQLVVAERTSDAGCNAAEVGHAALSRFSELHAQSGNVFMDQWKSRYLAEIYPFEFKHASGGPEFDTRDRSRHDDCPMVDMHEYTSGLPRRCERQVRSSWNIVPAIHNLYFRRSLLEGSSITYKHSMQPGEMTAEHGKELCDAAAELYQMLYGGYYRTAGGRRRAVGGDIAKLRHAEHLSEKAKLLLRSIRYVSSHLGGVQEVRTKIGNALFGARVVYGEPLFVTVSPSSRHSGLSPFLFKFDAVV